MTSISTTQELLPGLTDYGVGKEKEVKSNDDLGQQDFLKLMTAQLKNQDPFAPMENGEFLAQMAQFSTVSGIEDVNKTLQSMTAGLAEFRVAAASNLVGQTVLVTGHVARPDDLGAINATVNFESPANEVNVSYTDEKTGELLHSQNFGTQGRGEFEFGWKDIPQNLVDERRAIKLTVTATDDQGTATVTPKVYARIVGVDLANGSNEMRLIIEDHGRLTSSEVTTLR